MTYAIQTKPELEEFVCQNWDKINEYLDSEQEKLPIPIYSSVDIRESKTKFAPVDNNIYPAGFNNMCALDLDAAAPVFQKAIQKLAPNSEQLAIIPESHTKNLFYLDHLAILGKTLRDSGFEVSFLSLDPALFEEGQTRLDLISHSKYDVVIHKGFIKEGILHAGEQAIDIAILNNDQSNPLPVEWSSVKTPIAPTPLIGWFKRQKNTHFCYYNKVVEKFSETFSIDSNLLQAKYKKVDDVDYSSKEGLDSIATAVDDLLSELPEGSNVFVKASQGTYGMGISVVSSGEEVLKMNRKARNKMDVGKNKIKFTSTLIQEGVETILKYDDMPAEVAIYLVDGRSVGGFMRTNKEKSAQSNLNSRGMIFRKFCISEIRQDQDHKAKEAIYTIIARLSTLASGHEIKDLI